MGRGAAEVLQLDRYEVLGSLGSGGMGVVYRALDRRAGHEVALKTVRHASGRDLYRFKREFRTLADIVHPNLVTLHELHTSGDEWFFTMELVSGVSFIDWVRPGPYGDAAPPDEQFDPTEPIPATGSGRTRREIVEAPLDLDRLLAALPQLVDAVLALHLCGKLHRDLKPSNVLVTPEGRVVVLDFGLVSDIEGMEEERTHETSAVVGTPVYMSPEQGANEPLVPASDWYSVGVMLYEALTGRRPFEGKPEEVIRRKQEQAPPRTRDVSRTVPALLDDLCARLLHRAPGSRPDGRALLAELARAPSRATLDLERAMAVQPFVGRGAELAALRGALGDSRRHSVALFVRGESGTGKSRLVREFIDELPPEVLVLEGRCYERESVPFKTLDTLVDALTGVLMRLPRARLRDAVPRDVAALARLFPVLRRVSALSERTVAALLPPDPQELRRRAFAALRHLLGRLANDGPLVIVLDDLHWGDADSAVFLAEVVHHPEPLPVLLVLVHQLEDDLGIVGRVQRAGPGLGAGDVRAVELGPLPEPDALALARAFGGGDGRAAALVRETAGHPLFLVELARSPSSALSLEELVAGRLAALPPSAAALARTVAVAARPLPLEMAARASGVETVTSELTMLRAEAMLRMRRMGDAEAAYCEAAHNRVRAAVVATMSDGERRRVHEALARTLEAGGSAADTESLVEHWLGAAQPARAARHAEEAAHAAEEVLAFQRAADLYALALRHGAHTGAERRALSRRRGEALVGAGQLEAAAAAFAAAASGAEGDEALQCERLQLEQLLRLGSLTEGLELARRVVEKVGDRLPKSPRAAIRALVAERVRLRLRGLGFVERREEDLAPDVRTRIDVLFSVASGLSLVEPSFGRLVQSRGLRAALDAGEPRRICVGLAYETAFLGLRGVRALPRIDRVAARTRDLAARVGRPDVLGIATGLEGIARYQTGRWKHARQLLEAGIQAMREHGTADVRWELNVAEHYLIVVLFYLGEIAELARRVHELLHEAVERGDVYAQQALRAWRCNMAWLLVGRPDEARAHMAAVGALHDRDEDFHLHRYWELSSHAHIDLYQGDVETAWSRVETMWRKLAASPLSRLQTVRTETAFLRARVALGRGHASEARRMAARLAREGAPWADAFAEQVRATIAAATGDAATAAARLDAARRRYEACDMWLHAAVVRLRHAELGGADPEAARAALRERGVADPDAVARMLCPAVG